MKKTFLIYYNNKNLTNKYSENLAKTIFELGLKKGDNLKCFPFNFFKDEKTDYKEESKNYHEELLEVKLINTTLTETWNRCINATIEIFLIDSN
jgi:hypothetical protein